MPVYLIHFEQRYKHAGHYLGASSDLEGRIRAHRENRGARLLEVVNGVGIAWSVVRVWLDGGYELEQQLKAQRNGPRLCPRCHPQGVDGDVNKRQWVVGQTDIDALGLLDVGTFYVWLLGLPNGGEAGWSDEGYDDPLVRWLQVLYGGQWQVNAGSYRWREWEWMSWSGWQQLPPWAIVFLDGLYQAYGNALVSREQALTTLNRGLLELATWQREQQRGYP